MDKPYKASGVFYKDECTIIDFTRLRHAHFMDKLVRNNALCQVLPDWSACEIIDLVQLVNGKGCRLVMNVTLKNGCKVLILINDIDKHVEYYSDSKIDVEKMNKNTQDYLIYNDIVCSVKYMVSRCNHKYMHSLKKLDDCLEATEALMLKKGEVLDLVKLKYKFEIQEKELSCERISGWEACVVDSMMSVPESIVRLRITMSQQYNAKIYVDINERYKCITCRYEKDASVIPDKLLQDVRTLLRKNLLIVPERQHSFLIEMKAPIRTQKINLEFPDNTVFNLQRISGEQYHTSYVVSCKNIPCWCVCYALNISDDSVTMEIRLYNQNVYVTLNTENKPYIICTYHDTKIDKLDKKLKEDIYTLLKINNCMTTLEKRAESVVTNSSPVLKVERGIVENQSATQESAIASSIDNPTMTKSSGDEVKEELTSTEETSQKVPIRQINESSSTLTLPHTVEKEY